LLYKYVSCVSQKFKIYCQLIITQHEALHQNKTLSSHLISFTYPFLILHYLSPDSRALVRSLVVVEMLMCQMMLLSFGLLQHYYSFGVAEKFTPFALQMTITSDVKVTTAPGSSLCPSLDVSGPAIPSCLILLSWLILS